MIKRRAKNFSLRPKVVVDEIQELVGCKGFSRKLRKLNGINRSYPTAWELNIIFDKYTEKISSDTGFEQFGSGPIFRLTAMSHYGVIETLRQN